MPHLGMYVNTTALSDYLISGRRGRGLDRCRPFIEGCSMRQGRLAGKEFPHYIVENFVEGDLNCSSYLPSDSQDLDVADLHDAVSQACAVSARFPSHHGDRMSLTANDYPVGVRTRERRPPVHAVEEGHQELDAVPGSERGRDGRPRLLQRRAQQPRLQGEMLYLPAGRPQ